MKNSTAVFDPSLGITAKNEKRKSERTMLREFLVNKLKDLYWAEKHLLEALPKMKHAATSELLKKVFIEHLKTTEKQVIKLEKVFALLEEKAESNKCHSIEGLTREAAEIIDETPKGTVTRELGLLIAAQKVEHYEIASYGGLAQLARVLGEKEVADLLDEILQEEKMTDNTLSNLAAGTIIND